MNGFHDNQLSTRADDIDELLKSVQAKLINYIRSADDELEAHLTHELDIKPTIRESLKPEELRSTAQLSLPEEAQGSVGLLKCLDWLLQTSVNTFSPGFLDKLYAATNAPGIASELILACLNTNLHVYQVSPALTLIETATTRKLAALFDLNGPRAGGMSVQGGSAANMTSIVVARNTLFPDTKVHGNANYDRRLIMFTSVHGHYSIEKAAQACGFGTAAVISVPVVESTGAMDPHALEACIMKVVEKGCIPFYVNATAGTTVLGSFDPITEIAVIAKRYNMWLHVDGSWGGSFVFSESLKRNLKGSKTADSITINPHKMLGVPLTCSFLLARDLKTFQDANTLKAGYLFHNDDHDEEATEDWFEPTDLADLTLQCGRRGDSLKMFLSWQYYGSSGYATKIDQAYIVASHLANLVHEEHDLVLVSPLPLPCLQVCFYYARNQQLLHDESPLRVMQEEAIKHIARLNGRVTVSIAKYLITKGFMVDYAPALENQPEVGKFLRVVVNLQTKVETVERLLKNVLAAGKVVTSKLSVEPPFKDSPSAQ